MLLALVSVFGVVIVLQLHGISGQLEGSRHATEALKEELQGICKKITEELQWYTKHTFANKLREWLEEIPKGVVEEFQWYKEQTFAHALRKWLEQMSKDVAEQLQTTAEEIQKTLASIEDNTSHE